jgi:hypothetical protein
MVSLFFLLNLEEIRGGSLLALTLGFFRPDKPQYITRDFFQSLSNHCVLCITIALKSSDGPIRDYREHQDLLHQTIPILVYINLGDITLVPRYGFRVWFILPV